MHLQGGFQPGFETSLNSVLDLVHFYHPELLLPLKLDQISAGELNWKTSSDGNGLSAVVKPSERRVGVQDVKNDSIARLNHAVHSLGGMPTVLFRGLCEKENQINERVDSSMVSIFSAFLFRRTMELRSQTNAARMIQNVWRRNRFRRRDYLSSVKMIQACFRVASKTILVRSAIRVENGIVCIQCILKTLTARKDIKGMYAIIQALQSHIALKRFLVLKEQSKTIQTTLQVVAVSRRTFSVLDAINVLHIALKTFSVKSALMSYKKDVLTLQAAFEARKLQDSFLVLSMATIISQSTFKIFSRKSKFLLEHRASQDIQSVLRCLELNRFHRLSRSNTVLTQGVLRSVLIKRVRTSSVRRSQIPNLIEFFGYRNNLPSCQMIDEAVNDLLLSKKSLMERQVKVIQSLFLSARIRRELSALTQSSSVFQVSFQSFLAQKKFARVLLLLQISAEVIATTLKTRMMRAVCRKVLEIQRTQSFQSLIKLKESLNAGPSRFLSQACILLRSSDLLDSKEKLIAAHSLKAGILTRRDRVLFLNSRESSINLQDIFRMVSTRTTLIRMQSAVATASSLRIIKYRRRLLSLRMSISDLEAVLVSMMQRGQLKALQLAVSNLQSLRFLNLQMRMASEVKSSIDIQAYLRSVVEVRKCSSLRNARETIAGTFETIQLQSHKKSIDYICDGVFSAYTKASLFQKLQNHVIPLQSSFETLRTRLQQNRVGNSCEVLKAAFRTSVQQGRFDYLKSRIVAVQASLMTFSQKSQIHQQRMACQLLVMVQAALKLKKTLSACSLLQSCLPIHDSVKLLIITRGTSVSIQSALLMFLERFRFIETRSSAVATSSSLCSSLRSIHVQRIRNASRVIQAVFSSSISQAMFASILFARSKASKKDLELYAKKAHSWLENSCSSTMKILVMSLQDTLKQQEVFFASKDIQTAFVVMIKKARFHYTRSQIQKTQSCLKTFLFSNHSRELSSAALAVQSSIVSLKIAKSFHEHRFVVETISASLLVHNAVQERRYDIYQIILAQARIRGAMTRLKSSEQVKHARMRIERATSRWRQENTIASRTEFALDVLLSGKRLSRIGEAIRQLGKAFHVLSTNPW